MAFEKHEEDGEEESLILMLSDKIGAAAGIKGIDVIIKEVKAHSKVVFEVIKSLSFDELGLAEPQLDRK